MSCGTKITGRYSSSYIDRQDLAEKLENEGEFGLARKVKYGDCLDDYELRRSRTALERQDMSRHFDYREEPCRCPREEEEG